MRVAKEEELNMWNDYILKLRQSFGDDRLSFITSTSKGRLALMLVFALSAIAIGFDLFKGNKKVRFFIIAVYIISSIILAVTL